MRPLRLYKWFAALCLLDCAVAAEPSPPVLVLNVTYYDFRVHEDIHNNPVTHPDFERSCHPGPRSFDPCVGEKGLVEEKLGWDGRRRACGAVHIGMVPCIACHDAIVPNMAPMVQSVLLSTQAGVHPWRLTLHAKLHHVQPVVQRRGPSAFEPALRCPRIAVPIPRHLPPQVPGVNRVIDGQAITLTGVEPLRERP